MPMHLFCILGALLAYACCAAAGRADERDGIQAGAFSFWDREDQT